MTSIRDRVEQALARISAQPTEAPVFTRVYAEQVRAQADAADARRRTGLSLGPLDGTIVSIKDLFDVAGEPTIAGSTLLRTAAPAVHDAPVVARLRRAGALIVGKTNMSEFAFSGLGLNPHYGTPANAIDPTRIPGGSSAGAGVSVAEGTSEISIGTDTGGSVRIPAAFNGVTGFKPTARRVPTDGAFPLSYTLDSIGPLARTVQRCADADAIMAGDEPKPVPEFPLAGLRLGIPRGGLLDDMDETVAAVYAAALRNLERAGARLIDVSVEDLRASMQRATAATSIASVEAAAIHAPWLETCADQYDPRVLRRILAGRQVTAPAFIATLRERHALIAAMDARLVPVDALILPTVPTVAPPLKPLAGDDALFGTTNLLTLRNPGFGNLFDLTGISLPVRTETLPVGLMLIGRSGSDMRLLAVAAGIEKHLGEPSHGLP
jgi:aspartyl-tRNA(Asn)/glutamyl-tRNA(Gln) amidotransferase subunit A